MKSLNEMELQSLRHLIGSHKLIANKLNEYSTSCQDTQIKKMFKDAAESAGSTATKLMSFL